jgi:hypothetical protein
MRPEIETLHGQGRLSLQVPVHQTVIRSFNLPDLGIDAVSFQRDLAPSYDALGWDRYDVRLARLRCLERCHPAARDRLHRFGPQYYAGHRGLEEVRDLVACLPADKRRAFDAIAPHRQWGIARFHIAFSRSGSPITERVPVGRFEQSVKADDPRSSARVFDEADARVVCFAAFRHLLDCLARLTFSLEEGCSGLRVFVHQVRTVVRRDTTAEVVPEGVHQDGADYIVSALVVERHAVLGGESVVCGDDKSHIYLRKVLLPGEGLFHADAGSPLWHDVSPIRLDPAAGQAEGKRSILGFDIHVIR